MEQEAKKAHAGPGHAVVAHDAWLTARKKLLEREKALSKEIAEVAALRQALPWEEVTTAYEFVAAKGQRRCTLRDLFRGRNTLVVQHVMFEDSNERPCAMCSAWVEQYNAIAPFLGTHCEFALVMAASADKIGDMAAKKQWHSLAAYSAGAQSKFGRDFGVSFAEEQIASGEKVYNYGKSAAFMQEMHGISVFRLGGDDKIYHTYSTYSAGLGDLLAALKLFDILPDGRNEERNLDWIKHKEDYQ